MENIKLKDKTSLGAIYNEETKCVEFRLYSKNATKVLLCIFEKPQGEDACMVLEMEKQGDIFFTSVKDYVLNCKKRPIYYGFRIFGPNWEYKENPTGIAASEYFDLYGTESSYEQGEHLPADYENPIDHCIEMEMIDGTHTHVNIWGYFSPIGESPVYNKKYTTYVYCESYKDVGTMTRWMTMTRPDINQTITMQVEPIFDGQWAVDRDAYFAYEDAPQMFFLDDHHKDVEIILQHFAEIGVWQPTTREEYYVII